MSQEQPTRTNVRSFYKHSLGNHQMQRNMLGLEYTVVNEKDTFSIFMANIKKWHINNHIYEETYDLFIYACTGFILTTRKNNLEYLLSCHSG